MLLSKEVIEQSSKEQAEHIARTTAFMSLMQYGNPARDASVTHGAMFDSVMASAANGGVPIESIMPQSLITMRDALKDKLNLRGERSFNSILDSIGTGVEAYRNRHGGSMPSMGLVAAALANGALLYGGLDSGKTNGLFDSANINPNANKQFLDSVSAKGSSHTAEVPTLAMVTIATTIANALPIVAYLPNPKGSQTVPLVYVRHVASQAYGETEQNAFLDGAKAAAQYFDAVHRFEMTSADQLTFTVKTARCKQSGTMSPDANSGRLPIVAGGTCITIGGVPFAHDEQSHTSGGATTGTVRLLEIGETGSFELDGVAYKLTQGDVKLGTDEISFTLDKALPADFKVIVSVIANYEAKDAQNKYILAAPSIDTKLEYSSVTAHGIRAIYTATIDALTQMQNELGVDVRAAFVAVVIAKLMLEQNVRLLSEAKARAIGTKSVRRVDLTRGSDMTQAFNNTSQLAAEILPALEEQKRRIIEKSSSQPSGFDHYVSGSLGTLVRVLADDTNFIPSGLTLGMPNSIVRIGSRGTDNYYYIPADAGVVIEGELSISVGGQPTSVRYGEILTIARNEQAPKAVFIGHIAVPVLTDDVRSQVFEQGVTFFTRQACQTNRNPRFGGQVAVTQVLNLPKSMTTEA